MLAYQYFRSYGLKTVRTRGFNHTGPRRGDVFVTSNFAKQIARIEAGLQEPVIEVGNLEAVRDFTDVRDMVRAYWLATERATAGEAYNVASGEGISIRSLLDRLLSHSPTEVEVRVDPARLRPSDVEVLIGDASRFRSETGWEPRIPLDYWRARLLRRVESAGVS
jgi:GDP-4-dehydro-6-deoxy-D-mannose reductase